MTLSDFGGTWPWRDEVIAAGATLFLLCILRVSGFRFGFRV